MYFTVSASMSVTSNNKYKGFERSFCIRMKSTLTKRGCQFKQSTGYRVSKNLHQVIIFFSTRKSKKFTIVLYIKIPLGRFESKERKCQTKQWSLLGM